MKAVRFRCPKCRAPHQADSAKAGRASVCRQCFGPLIVPGEVEVVGTPASKPGFRFRDGLTAASVALVALAAAFAVTSFPRPQGGPAPADAPRAEIVQVPAEVPPAPPRPADPVPPPPIAVVDAPEAPKPDPNDPDRPLVIRRRQVQDQEALRRQLAGLPEFGATDRTEKALVALHHVASPGKASANRASQSGRPVSNRKRPANSEAESPSEDEPIPPPRTGMHVARAETAPGSMMALIREKQPELAALPWRMGDECHLGREPAEDLQSVSRALRTLLVQSTPQNETRPDADRLRAALLEEPAEEEAQAQGAPQSPLAQNPLAAGQRKTKRRRANQVNLITPAAIPALQQLLMAERTPVRMVLVDVLGKIECRDATKALAKLAMFDLAPEVREHALLALRSRPFADYRPSLLEGLRYPWAPVADHAAEALVALGDREAVAGLVALLDLPDPLRPRAEVRDGKPITVAPALVQVNHLQNCVLCHAPSGDPERDFVRGRVPDESQPLPPPVEYYASNSPGLFVRADVTYLRQEFSVTQPVEQNGPWPSYQRYDYLLTEKPTSRWISPRSPDQDEYPQRESVLFALRELTGRDLGPKSAAWKLEIPPKPQSSPE